jgi:hypothetical protein
MNNGKIPFWLYKQCLDCKKDIISRKRICKYCRRLRGKEKKDLKRQKIIDLKQIREGELRGEKRVNISFKSEFSVQVKLYNELIRELPDYSIFGEVGIVVDKKRVCSLDIAIVKDDKIICAVEVKITKKGHIMEARRQVERYNAIGIDNMFVCFGERNISKTVFEIKSFLSQ